MTNNAIMLEGATAKHYGDDSKQVIFTVRAHSAMSFAGSAIFYGVGREIGNEERQGILDQDWEGNGGHFTYPLRLCLDDRPIYAQYGIDENGKRDRQGQLESLP